MHGFIHFQDRIHCMKLCYCGEICIFKKITCFMKRWRTSMGFQLWKHYKGGSSINRTGASQPMKPIKHTCCAFVLFYYFTFGLFYPLFCHTIVVVHWYVRNHTNQKEGFCYSTHVCWVRRQVCMIYLKSDTLSSFPTEYIEFFLNPLFCFVKNINLKWLYCVLYFRYKLLAKTKNCPPNAESCRNILASAKITGWHIG